MYMVFNGGPCHALVFLLISFQKVISKIFREILNFIQIKFNYNLLVISHIEWMPANNSELKKRKKFIKTELLL